MRRWDADALRPASPVCPLSVFFPLKERKKSHEKRARAKRKGGAEKISVKKRI